jgi:hypothetical protein
MPFSWDEFADAVSGYPADNVTLGVVDLAPHNPSSGSDVNTNDVWKFQVRVRNNGHLNMTGVALRITGQNGVRVSTNPIGPWLAAINAFPLGVGMTLNAHSAPQDTPGFIYFKAPGQQIDTVKELVCVQIARFDANLNHLLIDHSGSSTQPKACYKDQVWPS